MEKKFEQTINTLLGIITVVGLWENVIKFPKEIPRKTLIYICKW